MTLKVDPEILRAFAASLSETGAAIRETDTLKPFLQCEKALQGSDFQSACAMAAAAAASAVETLADRAECVSDIARGVAQNYEVADGEFIEKLDAMDTKK